LVRLAESLGEDPILLKSVIEINERQSQRLLKLLDKKIGDLGGKRDSCIGAGFQE
jgi:UDPglucose 6-dehydrogenase